ncbi:MAG: hypothetical protein DMG65_00170 [Candidatus Angelobacter sp. Gp1-AA117]|nr:MAG: hypothetical protein DMG65_00170 [Candidatus Angelobacter sp. Gp1-AA117]
MHYGWGWPRYVSAAERRRQAVLKMAKLRKQGKDVSPVVIQGRAIATTFWGKAWCDNLERYSDFENRLPRGRTYARNGSVIDLKIAAGEIKALVSGSSIYKVTIKIAAVSKPRWKSICKDCAGGIDSLIELLQGRFSKAVMERMCQQKTGLFPSPDHIEFSCSCPDWATMCKHVAAVLYGIGARLDQQPELLFRLNQVDEKELISRASDVQPLTGKGPVTAKVLSAGEDLSEIFGLDMAQGPIAVARLTNHPNGTKPKRPKVVVEMADGSVRSKKMKRRAKKRRTNQKKTPQGRTVEYRA